MSAQVELTPVQLAALDLMIANKQAASPDTANCWIDCIVNYVVQTTPIVTAIAGAAVAAATTSQAGSSSLSEALSQTQNISLEQLKQLRSQYTSK